MLTPIRQLASQDTAPLTWEAISQAEYFFSSPHQQIVAQGCRRRLILSVEDIHGNDAGFAQQIQQALSEEARAGVAHPVCLGVVPFDKREPACLIMPEQVQRFAKRSNLHYPVQETQRLVMRHCSSNLNQQAFQLAVAQAQANFQYSDIRKVVLGRILRVEAQQDFNQLAILQQLIAQNPHAYHYRFRLPDQSVLMGASPELLLRKQAGAIFSHPLAGSAKRLSDAAADQAQAHTLSASVKDHYEHSLVTRGIEHVLAPLCRELHVPKLPELFSTSTMWHLGTPIRGELQQTEMNALVLAAKLHPTPALGGYPTALARKLIDLIEPESRNYFGGIVGWCDAHGDGEWAVVIRSGEFAGARAKLFAGAGIVEDSEAEAEWLETKAKLQTMLNALNLQAETQMDATYKQEAA